MNHTVSFITQAAVPRLRGLGLWGKPRRPVIQSGSLIVEAASRYEACNIVEDALARSGHIVTIGPADREAYPGEYRGAHL